MNNTESTFNRLPIPSSKYKFDEELYVDRQHHKNHSIKLYLTQKSGYK